MRTPTIAFTTALLVLSSASAPAAVPVQTPVQGSLADNAGEPVADGAFQMTFSLYAAADAESPMWSESWPPGEANCSEQAVGCVAVTGGVFSVQLGSHEPLAAALFADSALWLGVSVEGEPELPRGPIGAAPYAWFASAAGGLDCTGCLSAAALSDEAQTALTEDALAAMLACSGCLSADALSDDARTALTEDAVAAALAAGGPVSGQDLPPDGLDEVSNGVLTNTFVATFTSPGAPIEVTDLWPPGVADVIELPPMGTIQSLSVELDLAHEAPEDVTISLTAPGGQVFVLHEHGPAVATVYDGDTELVAGDLSTLDGTEAGGLWTLLVIDDVWSGGGVGGTVVSWSIVVEALSDDKAAVQGDLEVAGKLTLTGGGELQARTNLALVPSGMIAMFEGDCPPGWAEVEALRQRFPMGWDGDGPMESGGSATAPHSHSVGSACGPGDCIDWAGGYSGGFAAPGGTSSAEPSIIPPYYEVVYCKKQ